MNKLGFSYREAQFLSMGEYADLFMAYQMMFDTESLMLAQKILGNNKCCYIDLSEQDDEQIINF